MYRAYDLGIASYVIAASHFGLEYFVYKGMTINRAFIPVALAACECSIMSVESVADECSGWDKLDYLAEGLLSGMRMVEAI